MRRVDPPSNRSCQKWWISKLFIKLISSAVITLITSNIIETFLNVIQSVEATALKNVVVDSRTISIKEKKVREEVAREIYEKEKRKTGKTTCKDPGPKICSKAYSRRALVGRPCKIKGTLVSCPSLLMSSACWRLLEVMLEAMLPSEGSRVLSRVLSYALRLYAMERPRHAASWKNQD